MTRHSTLLIAVFLGCASHLVGQVTLTAREFVVQVYPAQPWTDAGLDLQSGDALELSATGSSDQHPASGATVCDPKGITATSANRGPSIAQRACRRFDRTSSRPWICPGSGRSKPRVSHRGAFPSNAGDEHVRHSALP